MTDRESPASLPLPSPSRLGVPGPRTEVRRQRQRAAYDADLIYRVIDEAPLCHAAVVIDGVPLVLPTAHARLGDAVYLHGAVANRLLSVPHAGGLVCLSFTLLDGFVFARTAFHHSMNYRSVVAYGCGQRVSDEQEKRTALSALVDHMAPGRSAELPAHTAAELAATLVVKVVLEEASFKTRTGMPCDEPQDVAHSTVWAGVIPLCQGAQPPLRDPLLPSQRGPSSAVLQAATRRGAESIRERHLGGYLLSTDRSRIDVQVVHEFLSQRAYWALGVAREQVECSIAHALCAGLYEGDRQVGFARLVSDHARIGYLSDVFVIEAMRGQGLGKALVEFVLSLPEAQGLSQVLLATRDAQSLYTRHGFAPASNVTYLERTSVVT